MARPSFALALTLLTLTSSTATGCATIVQGTDQPVRFSVRNAAMNGTSAASFIGRVDYNNGQSSGTASLPGSASVERSNNAITLTFSYVNNAGENQAKVITVPSTETGWIAGNAGIAVATLGVGIIGAVVDGITNASREYPEEFILDVATDRVVLKYEDSKTFYVYDEDEKKFHKTDESGTPLHKSADAVSRSKAAN